MFQTSQLVTISKIKSVKFEFRFFLVFHLAFRSILFFSLSYTIESHAEKESIVLDSYLKKANLTPRVIYRSPIDRTENDTMSRSKSPLADLEFGTLSLQQFTILNNYYRKLSFVPYSPQRIYYLTDFLPPQIQALLGKDFQTELTLREVPPLSEFFCGVDDIFHQNTPLQTVDSTSQCWGTFWNVVRVLQYGKSYTLLPFDILLISAEEASDYLLSDRYSNKVNSDIYQFGDLIAAIAKTDHEQDSIPLHFSTYIGFGFVFEKEDDSVGTPYRVVSKKVSLRELRESVNQNVFLKNSVISIEHRRFLDTKNKPSLPRLTKTSKFLNTDSLLYYGKIASRLSILTRSRHMGGEDPELQLNTPIRFEIDLDTNRGKIWQPHLRYFSEAYKSQWIQTHCNQLLQVEM